MKREHNRKRNKKRGRDFQARQFQRGPAQCNRCDRRKPLTFIARYGVSLCKLCTFEMDMLTKQPSRPGMYPRDVHPPRSETPAPSPQGAQGATSEALDAQGQAPSP